MTFKIGFTAEHTESESAGVTYTAPQVKPTPCRSLVQMHFSERNTTQRSLTTTTSLICVAAILFSLTASWRVWTGASHRSTTISKSRCPTIKRLSTSTRNSCRQLLMI